MEKDLENCTDKLSVFSFRYFWESYLHDNEKKPFECKCTLKIYGNSVCDFNVYLIVFAKFMQSKHFL